MLGGFKIYANIFCLVGIRAQCDVLSPQLLVAAVYLHKFCDSHGVLQPARVQLHDDAIINDSLQHLVNEFCSITVLYVLILIRRLAADIVNMSKDINIWILHYHLPHGG